MLVFRDQHTLPKFQVSHFINTFACDALTSNGNELYEPPSNQGKAYTDTDSDGKTEIINDITCKFKGKLVAMEVKVDPGSETNCIPLSHFRQPVPSAMQKGWQSQGEHPGTNSGSVWSIWWWHHDQPQMDHTAYSGHQRTTTSFILWDTM